MDAFDWLVNGPPLFTMAQAAVAALVALVFLTATLWSQLSTRRRARTTAAELARLAAEASRSAGEVGTLRNTLAETANRLGASERLTEALQAQVRSSETDPSRLAANYLRVVAETLGQLRGEVEAGRSAKQRVFAEAVDSSLAGNGAYRLRSADDNALNDRRRSIDAVNELDGRMRIEIARVRAIADDFDNNVLDVRTWRREVDMLIGTRDEYPTYHAPGWPDFVTSIRGSSPPEPPSSDTAPPAPPWATGRPD